MEVEKDTAIPNGQKLERAEKAWRPAFTVPRCSLAFTSLSRIEFSLTPRLDNI